jgi:hypothetical protein
MELNAPPAKSSHWFVCKVMACSFFGIQIPLVGAMLYFSFVTGSSVMRFTLTGLLFSLASAATTLLLIYRLMRPLQKGNRVIQGYIASNTLQPMPKHSNDELGILFQQVEYLMFVLQKTVSERNHILEMAVTSNRDFQRSLQEFVMARERAFLQDDNGKMKAALEEALHTAQSKLETAGRILHNFGSPN